MNVSMLFFFFFSSRRRHTRWTGDWSSDVCSSDLGLLAEDARDVFRGQIGAVRGGDAEVARHVLEAIGLEVARAHVVELGEDPGVHDVPAADPVAPVADGPLGDLHARGIAAEG